MNSRKSLFLFLAINLLSLVPTKANDCISFPTGPAAWTIEMVDSPNYKAPPSSLIAKIVKIEVTQDAKFLRSMITFADNKSQEDWNIVGTDLFISNDANGTVAITPVNLFFFVPFTPSSFDWVNAACLQEKGAIEYQGKKCFHYKSAISFSPTSGYQVRKGETLLGEAWIDSKTHLPVAFDDGKTLASFDFLPTPTAPLVMPANYKRLLDGYKMVMGLPKPQ